jgi:hypothetical protein
MALWKYAVGHDFHYILLDMTSHWCLTGGKCCNQKQQRPDMLWRSRCSPSGNNLLPFVLLTKEKSNSNSDNLFQVSARPKPARWCQLSRKSHYLPKIAFNVCLVVSSKCIIQVPYILFRHHCNLKYMGCCPAMQQLAMLDFTFCKKQEIQRIPPTTSGL